PSTGSSPRRAVTSRGSQAAWGSDDGLPLLSGSHPSLSQGLPTVPSMDDNDALGQEALALLRKLTGDPASEFRPDQIEVIRRLVGERQRMLLVQRTGWGKSAVYFIATRMLRDRGAGPTLLVSPPLALMRNQIEAADRIGVRAATINSANRDDWEAIEEQLDAGLLDILLISPERLAND